MNEGTITINRSDLEELLRSWEHNARRLFADAPRDKSTVTATRAMEHDAIIYINCGTELSKIIGLTFPLPSLSGTKEGDQK